MNIRSFHIVKPYMVLKNDIHRYAGQVAKEKTNKQTKQTKDRSNYI